MLANLWSWLKGSQSGAVERKNLPHQQLDYHDAIRDIDAILCDLQEKLHKSNEHEENTPRALGKIQNLQQVRKIEEFKGNWDDFALSATAKPISKPISKPIVSKTSDALRRYRDEEENWDDISLPVDKKPIEIKAPSALSKYRDEEENWDDISLPASTAKRADKKPIEIKAPSALSKYRDEEENWDDIVLEPKTKPADNKSAGITKSSALSKYRDEEENWGNIVPKAKLSINIKKPAPVDDDTELWDDVDSSTTESQPNKPLMISSNLKSIATPAVSVTSTGAKKGMITFRLDTVTANGNGKLASTDATEDEEDEFNFDLDSEETEERKPHTRPQRLQLPSNKRHSMSSLPAETDITSQQSRKQKRLSLHLKSSRMPLVGIAPGMLTPRGTRKPGSPTLLSKPKIPPINTAAAIAIAQQQPEIVITNTHRSNSALSANRMPSLTLRNDTWVPNTPSTTSSSSPVTNGGLTASVFQELTPPSPVTSSAKTPFSPEAKSVTFARGRPHTRSRSVEDPHTHRYGENSNMPVFNDDEVQKDLQLHFDTQQDRQKEVRVTFHDIPEEYFEFQRKRAREHHVSLHNWGLDDSKPPKREHFKSLKKLALKKIAFEISRQGPTS